MRKIKLTLSSRRLKRKWMKKWMMWSTWTKWSSTLKSLPSEISNWLKTNSLNLSGLKSKRNLILWWRLRGLRLSKRKKSVKSESMQQERLELKSLLIKFKREQSREWRNKKLETKKEPNCLLTSIKWREKMTQLLKLKD